MYLRQEEVCYSSFAEMWSKGYGSKSFSAVRDDEADLRNLPLSERLLFTQSNGRALLGHDARGRLHFLCVPHESDYAIPSGGPRVGGQFDGHIGQFYQTDAALLLGKLRYEIELAGGYVYEAAGRDAETYYLDHVLPVTKSEFPHLSARVYSLAPILEESARKVSPTHPLPGPSGALYGLDLTNTGGAPLRGKVRLRFDPRFLIQCERFDDGPYEDKARAPRFCEWDGRLFKCGLPEASMALQMLGAQTRGMPETPEIFAEFELEPGESRDFCTVVACAPTMREIDAALGTLYRHTAFEWIQISLAFWRKRLGNLEIEMRGFPEWGERYRDMHLRFILDNFNCISLGASGEMLVNWQGAPSHGLARMWGIDVEPTAISVMYAVPEIGPSAIRYMLDHNVPQYSVYPDHSTPIFVAPFILAGKYLELTGDRAFFSEPGIMEKFRAHLRGLLRCKHPDCALFSSRYASDLITFNRYDYMTNVKVWLALKSYAAIQRAVGEDPSPAEALMDGVRRDLARLLEADGPFGRQIKGGSNLGECEGERFYNRDDEPYYCGEDSFTCMAPVYGLYGFDYAPWRNLHKCARSLFLPNYDPEYQSLRELHYGMNPSGTGYTLRLGGSVAREEMARSLSILFQRLDATGSLFWWPRGENKRRVLTRCSQGQGSWVQQSVEQWMGLRLDALAGELRVCPQGLASALSLRGIRMGNHVFDVEWRETEQESALRVVNRVGPALKLIFGQRPFGAGAEGGLRETSCALPEGGEARLTCPARRNEETMDPDEVGKAEARAFAEGGAAFGAYGMLMPNLYSGPCDVFQLRFVALFDRAVSDAAVTVEVPEGWKIAQKAPFVWEDEPEFAGRTARAVIGRAEPYRHCVAAFHVLLPRKWIGANHVLLSSNPFSARRDGAPQELWIRAGERAEGGVVRAELSWTGGSRTTSIPVKILPAAEFEARFDRILRGPAKAACASRESDATKGE